MTTYCDAGFKQEAGLFFIVRSGGLGGCEIRGPVAASQLGATKGNTTQASRFFTDFLRKSRLGVALRLRSRAFVHQDEP